MVTHSRRGNVAGHVGCKRELDRQPFRRGFVNGDDINGLVQSDNLKVATLTPEKTGFTKR